MTIQTPVRGYFLEVGESAMISGRIPANSEGGLSSWMGIVMGAAGSL
jgi:hypothetical protein